MAQVPRRDLFTVTLAQLLATGRSAIDLSCISLARLAMG
jgi:hypothetical protein